MQGYSLLHFALSSCEEESTVELLLKSGVDPRVNINNNLNLFDYRSKSTMLHKAAKRGWEGVVQSLLSAGLLSSWALACCCMTSRGLLSLVLVGAV